MIDSFSYLNQLAESSFLVIDLEVGGGYGNLFLDNVQKWNVTFSSIPR